MVATAVRSPQRTRPGPSPALILTSGLPAALFALFAFAHILYWAHTKHLTGLPTFVQELLLTGLLLIRRPAREVSSRLADWGSAAVATFGVLLLRPGGADVGRLPLLWTGVQAVGTIAVLYGSGHLGRSFGLVAANRGVKVSGPYRVVRHPLYASYLLGEIGYLLASASLRNALIVVVVLAGQLWRIHAEERILVGDPVYRDYQRVVRYRLVPGLY